MRKLLIVIDMQNDFIDGALGSKEAVSIVDAVKKKIRSYPPNVTKLRLSPNALIFKGPCLQG